MYVNTMKQIIDFSISAITLVVFTLGTSPYFSLFFSPIFDKYSENMFLKDPLFLLVSVKCKKF